MAVHEVLSFFQLKECTLTCIVSQTILILLTIHVKTFNTTSQFKSWFYILELFHKSDFNLTFKSETIYCVVISMVLLMKTDQTHYFVSDEKYVQDPNIRQLLIYKLTVLMVTFLSSNRYQLETRVDRLWHLNTILLFTMYQVNIYHS